MEGTAVVVGIDVSKDRLDVHVRPSGETLTVERTAAGLDALCCRLRQIAPRIVALEATGGFETIATAALAAAGLPVVVVNPAQVRSFARALGRRAKTDPIDAAVIAHFAAATEIEVRPLKDQATRLLGELVGRRRQITEMIRAEHNRARRITEPRLQNTFTAGVNLTWNLFNGFATVAQTRRAEAGIRRAQLVLQQAGREIEAGMLSEARKCVKMVADEGPVRVSDFPRSSIVCAHAQSMG